MDAAAPALLVGQAVGRIGNYFNQELFGGPTNLPWALQISPAHRPAGYAAFATFQPTFLYELIWNLCLAAALVWLGHHRRIRPPGLFALYVAGYSAFRIFEESLRVDPAHYYLGLRLNFYVAALLCLGGLVWFVASQRREIGEDGARRPHLAGGEMTEPRGGQASTSRGRRKRQAQASGRARARRRTASSVQQSLDSGLVLLLERGVAAVAQAAGEASSAPLDRAL